MNKIKPIEIKKPKVTLKNAGRSTGFIIGLAIFTIGIIMMMTIILILPGIFGVLVGLVMLVMNVPKAEVECPSCGYDNKAAPPKASVECERCKNNIPIKWVKK